MEGKNIETRLVMEMIEDGLTYKQIKDALEDGDVCENLIINGYSQVDIEDAHAECVHHISGGEE
jgi:hypothetical protein